MNFSTTIVLLLVALAVTSDALPWERAAMAGGAKKDQQAATQRRAEKRCPVHPKPVPQEALPPNYLPVALKQAIVSASRWSKFDLEP